MTAPRYPLVFTEGIPWAVVCIKDVCIRFRFPGSFHLGWPVLRGVPWKVAALTRQLPCCPPYRRDRPAFRYVHATRFRSVDP